MGAERKSRVSDFALRAPSPPIAAQWVPPLPLRGRGAWCCAWGFPPPPLRGTSPVNGGGEGVVAHPETQEGTTPLRASCLPVCFESVYRDTVLALDIGLRSTSGSGDNPFERITLHHPPDPDVRLFRRTASVSVAAVHNRGVAGTRLTACACHCWHSLLGHRLRIAPRYGIRPRLAGSSSRLPAIACFVPSSPPGPFAPPVSRLCS